MTTIKLSLFILNIIFLPMTLSSQEAGLELFYETGEGLVLHHTLAEGQTLYGISKTYGADINTLMTHNSQNKVDDLKIGQDIVVPIAKESICYRADNCSFSQKIPVLYTAQKKDNLFRIARIYFNTSVEQVKLLNQMHSTVLSNDQVLLIGWLPYNDELKSYLSPKAIKVISQVTPQEAEIREEAPVAMEESATFGEPVLVTMNTDKAEEVNVVLEGIGRKNERINENIYADVSGDVLPAFNPANRKLITSGATAYWNKNKSSKKGYYILHKDLPVNTMIRITNPVTGNTVLAKVVGEIPDKIYAPEISLVVTTEVAQALGAIDKKFYTRIAYPELGL